MRQFQICTDQRLEDRRLKVGGLDGGSVDAMGDFVADTGKEGRHATSTANSTCIKHLLIEDVICFAVFVVVQFEFPLLHCRGSTPMGSLGVAHTGIQERAGREPEVVRARMCIHESS